MRNEKLVIKYLPLARKLGRKYDAPHIDGIAEAQFAMVLAAQTFDVRKGGSFPLYVEYAIRNRLKRLRAKSLPVSIDWQEVEADGEQASTVELAALAQPPTQEARVFRHEFVRYILKCLTREEKRLLLYLLREERQTQIAERLGISQPTVSRRIAALGNRARELVGAYNGGRPAGG